MDDKTIIDIDEALERVQDDEELFLELLDIFQEDYEEKHPELVDGIENGDAGKIQNIVHSLKGAASNISAKQIQACCAEMELLAEQNQLENFQEKAARLHEEYGRLKAKISEIKQKMGGA